MTRFWVTLQQGVKFVVDCLTNMTGGEIFIPKLPSMKVEDLARAIAPECRHRIVGIRPGEKLHEVLITEDEARSTIEFSKHYVVQPGAEFGQWENGDQERGKPIAEGFRYSSDSNESWLTDEELSNMVEIHEHEENTLRTTVD